MERVSFTTCVYTIPNIISEYENKIIRIIFLRHIHHVFLDLVLVDPRWRPRPSLLGQTRKQRSLLYQFNLIEIKLKFKNLIFFLLSSFPPVLLLFPLQSSVSPFISLPRRGQSDYSVFCKGFLRINSKLLKLRTELCHTCSDDDKLISV